MTTDLDTFTTEFEAMRGELKSFLLRMTVSAADAEDLAQETYIRASAKLNTFRGEASLKTWVFAIAANLTRDQLRAAKRWPENVTDICKEAALSNVQFFQEAMHIRHTSPQGQFEIREHVSFCFTCVSKSLPLEQQLTVFLKEVYSFKVKEIATIMSISEAMVKHHLHHGRQALMRIFDQRCSLINKEGICYQCTELNGIFNPEQDAAEEVAKLKLARAAANADKEELLALRTKILQELDPFESGAAELQLHHLEHNRQVMQQHLAENESR